MELLWISLDLQRIRKVELHRIRIECALDFVGFEKDVHRICGGFQWACTGCAWDVPGICIGFRWTRITIIGFALDFRWFRKGFASDFIGFASDLYRMPKDFAQEFQRMS